MRSISSGRHWVSTWIVTSSGIRSSSISWRTKSKSGWLADGKPTSISLKPISTSGLEHAPLALRVHRVDQRLVAVAQVDRAPQRGLRRCAGPATCGPGSRGRAGRTAGTSRTASSSGSRAGEASEGFLSRNGRTSWPGGRRRFGERDMGRSPLHKEELQGTADGGHPGQCAGPGPGCQRGRDVSRSPPAAARPRAGAHDGTNATGRGRRPS